MSKIEHQKIGTNNEHVKEDLSARPRKTAARADSNARLAAVMAGGRTQDYGDGVDGAHLGIGCATMVVVETIHQRSAVHGQAYDTRRRCHHRD